MEQKPSLEQFGGTVGELLDRLDVKIGRIGFNNPHASLAILTGLDEAAQRIEEVQNESGQRQLQVEFNSLTAKLRAQAGPFLRGLGGVTALQQARKERQPPHEYDWWYLDEYLSTNRKAAIRRSLIRLGVGALILLVLGLIYNFFLAPDPQVMARYGHEQSARDDMMNGDYATALSEVEQGLTYAPEDPTLLILRGVIRQMEGSEDTAAQDFALAQKGLSSQTEFLLTRGQAYLMINQTELGLADARAALQANPNSAEAYLLSGQAHETTRQFPEALEDYNKAFEAADRNKQTELAAISRTKMAMLMQVMNVQGPSEVEGTPTP